MHELIIMVARKRDFCIPLIDEAAKNQSSFNHYLMNFFMQNSKKYHLKFYPYQ